MKFIFITAVFLFLLSISGGNAQSVEDLIANYSGGASWNNQTGELRFTSSGTVYFASKVGTGSNLREDQKQHFWAVPSNVKKILIEDSVTVTCAFHTYANLTIEGENRYTSVVYGTSKKQWADKYNDAGIDLQEWYYCQFQNFGGVLTINNLTSKNPFSYHVRGWGTLIHVSNCDFIDTRGGSQNHSDGFCGGDGSTVTNCFFETGDDIFKIYFDYTVTNCTVKMVENCVPIQLGWGDYPNNSVGTFQNLTIYGTSGRWGPNKSYPVICGRRGTYKVTVNIDTLFVDNPNASMVILYDDNGAKTLNGAITNADISVKQFTNQLQGTCNLTICGTTERKNKYDCYNKNPLKKEVENNHIRLYPNPANNNFVITGMQTASKIKVYNLSGLLLQTIYIDGTEAAINTHLKQGLYLVEIEEEKHRSIKKLMIL